MITIYLITENLTDNVNIVIQRYKNHPSIIAIPRLVTRKDNFLSSKWRMKKLENFKELRHQEGFSEYSYSNKNNKRKLAPLRSLCIKRFDKLEKMRMW